VVIWYISRRFGILYQEILATLNGIPIFPFWYVWTEKNLATLTHNTLFKIISLNGCQTFQQFF
jgi:hypothetical protein